MCKYLNIMPSVMVLSVRWWSAKTVISQTAFNLSYFNRSEEPSSSHKAFSPTCAWASYLDFDWAHVDAKAKLRMRHECVRDAVLLCTAPVHHTGQVSYERWISSDCQDTDIALSLSLSILFFYLQYVHHSIPLRECYHLSLRDVFATSFPSLISKVYLPL